MLIDFFNDCRRNDCDKIVFGLCDDSKEGETKPAYINYNNTSSWIAIVNNSNAKLLSFYAIDGCVKWNREDGTESEKCDGMLSYDDDRCVVFVELKNRKMKNNKWRIDAKEQLAETINCFFRKYERNHFKIIEAYVCNKRHIKQQRYDQFCNNFKKETSVTLHVNRKIDVI